MVWRVVEHLLQQEVVQRTVVVAAQLLVPVLVPFVVGHLGIAHAPSPSTAR
jgi:hypothetical protein